MSDIFTKTILVFCCFKWKQPRSVFFYFCFFAHVKVKMVASRSHHTLILHLRWLTKRKKWCNHAKILWLRNSKKSPYTSKDTKGNLWNVLDILSSLLKNYMLRNYTFMIILNLKAYIFILHKLFHFYLFWNQRAQMFYVIVYTSMIIFYFVWYCVTIVTQNQ